MARFDFYQDTEVRCWVRDYYTIEANSLEEAIELAKSGKTLDELEDETAQVHWKYRDYSLVNETMIELDSFGIYSCDLELDCKESEVFAK